MPRDGHPPYFPFYPDDFASDGDVEAMSTAQVGAYILLLCKAWREDPVGSVPDDDRCLARWARMTPVEWSEAKSAVMFPFSLRTDGRWHQPRMQREFMKLRESSRRRAEAGAAGAEKRWGNGKRMAKPKQCYSDANATALRSDGMSSSTSHSELKPPNPPVGGRTRKPPGFCIDDVTFPDGMGSPAVRQAVADWLDHKRAKGRGYKSAKQVEILIGKWLMPGPAAFVDAIENSIANNYDGVHAGGPRTSEPGQHRRESHEQARERANHEAIAGFLRSSGVCEGDADAHGAEANGEPHRTTIESVARRVGHVPAGND